DGSTTRPVASVAAARFGRPVKVAGGVPQQAGAGKLAIVVAGKRVQRRDATASVALKDGALISWAAFVGGAVEIPGGIADEAAFRVGALTERYMRCKAIQHVIFTAGADLKDRSRRIIYRRLERAVFAKSSGRGRAVHDTIDEEQIARGFG